ncbi:MAG: tail fiber protein [Cellulosilyticaceae bacterium]
MKQTKNFNINVPELGDLPDITQVSNAIQSLEDALAGTLEIMTASIQSNKVTLTSGSRATKRTRYYEGMAIKFVAPIHINPNTITLASVDDLADQVVEIPFLVNAGDSVDIIYKGNKFVATITAIQRSNSVTSTSTTTVATSQAVKTLNDSKISKSGDAMTGNIEWNAYGENYIGYGNGDNAGFEANNLKISSWNGIGFSPNADGQLVQKGKYSHFFNTRNGDIGIKGQLRMNNGMRFYADKGGAGIANTDGLGVFYSDNSGNVGLSGKLRVPNDVSIGKSIFCDSGAVFSADGNVMVKAGGYNEWLTNILDQIKNGYVPKQSSSENTVLHKPQGSNQLYVNNAGSTGWNAVAMDYSNAPAGVFSVGSLQIRTGDCYSRHGQTNTTINFAQAFPTGCISVFLVSKYNAGDWPNVRYMVEGYSNAGFWFRAMPQWDLLFSYVAIGY